MKYKIFEKELNYIKNEELKNKTIELLNGLPNYFYKVPASSTGKYHPSYALGEGGLVRHTKAGVNIGVDLLRCEQFCEDSDNNRDIVVVSLLLHDGFKSGLQDTGFTDSKHPIFVTEYIIENTKDFNDKYIINDICQCVLSHMGKWNSNRDGVEILPKPTSSIERLVHLADYIASRKNLEYIFEV